MIIITEAKKGDIKAELLHVQPENSPPELSFWYHSVSAPISILQGGKVCVSGRSLVQPKPRSYSS